MYDDAELTRQIYTMFLGRYFDGTPHYASLFEECGECKEKCPQEIPIRENLKKAGVSGEIKQHAPYPGHPG